MPQTTTYAYDLIGRLTSTTYANGVISVNTFDILDRLDKLTQYLPDATPVDLSDNTVLAEYDYTLAADGTRIGLTEMILKESGAGYDVNVFTWTYDNLNRLLSETLVSSIADFSYEANYVYSLSNNRVSYSLDHADNAKDQSVTYLYDANDRLVTETKFESANFTGAGVDTTYTYSAAGEMIGKTVDSDPSQSESFTFNLQGRLASHTKAGVTTLFRYDTSGIRVSSAEYSLADTLPTSSAAWGTGASEIVAYLIDDQNHTGYAQVLEERNVPPGEVAALAAVTKAYVLGMDVLQQFTPADAANGLPIADNLILLPDGHGSTRLLLASAAAVLAGSGLMVPGQRFFYDAYGNLLAPVGASTPLTTLLYTGEQRDSATGMYYLRARYYNPSMGRFASMDPWSGNVEEPSTLQKYRYGNNNPLNTIDPSGEIDINLSSLTVRMAVGAIVGGVIGGVYGGVRAFADTISDPQASWADVGLNTLTGTLGGAFFGALLGGLAPAMPWYLHLILGGLAVPAAILGTYNAVQDSWSQGKYVQGSIRLFFGTMDTLMAVVGFRAVTSAKFGSVSTNPASSGGRLVPKDIRSIYASAMKIVGVKVEYYGRNQPFPQAASGARGSYLPTIKTVRLREDATWLELVHETFHVLFHFQRYMAGKPHNVGSAFKAEVAESEMFVFRMLQETFWPFLSKQEQQFSYNYVKSFFSQL